MLVPHDALVVVADGRKLLILRNEGDMKHLNLQVEDKQIHESPRDRDQKSDAAGQSSSTQSGPGAPAIAQGGSMHARGQGAQFAPSRGTMDEVDFHQMEESRFAAEVAALLNKRALAGAFDNLIIAAPPRTLGELRRHYHEEVKSRLICEIDKDLTSHPVPRIEQALARVS